MLMDEVVAKGMAKTVSVLAGDMPVSTKNQNYVNGFKMNPRISGLRYDPYLMISGKNEAVWYDDSVIAFRYDGRYSYYCTANGTVEMCYKPTGERIKSEGDNAEEVRNVLKKWGLTTDALIERAEQNGELVVKSRNEYVDELYDKAQKKWFFRKSMGPLAISREYMEELIKQGESGSEI